MKLSEFTTTYVSALNNQQVGANIVCIVRRLIDHCGDVELSDLHSVDLTAWSAAIVAERGVLHETARGYCKIIRRLWRGAADRGLCDPPPAITSKRPPRERSTSIPADQWEPQRLALADVQANTPLTVVWVSCFPAAERDKQTKFALLDLCELLERPPIVSDLAGSTFERFASWAPGLGQSTKTVERRLSCLRRLRRDLAAHGAEPIPRPPKPKRANADSRRRRRRPGRQFGAFLPEHVPTAATSKRQRIHDAKSLVRDSPLLPFSEPAGDADRLRRCNGFTPVNAPARARRFGTCRELCT
jgi:hypothetical protein